MSLLVIVFACAVLLVLIVFTLNEVGKRPPPKFDARPTEPQEEPASELLPAQVDESHQSSEVPESVQPVLARWTIRYRSSSATTTRNVRITRVHPRKHQIVGWCELRGQERTFSLFAIDQALDTDTGEVIDLNEWMAAYRKSRRSKQAT